MKKIKALAITMAVFSTVTMGGCETTWNADNPQSLAALQSSTQEAPELSEPVVLSIFLDQTKYDVDTFNDEVAREITKRTGVTLKVTLPADENQLPTMIASGEYTDLIYSPSLFIELSNSKVCYPWNELISKYAPDFDIPRALIGINTVDDGNFYTIKNNFGTEEEWADSNMLPNPGYAGISLREDVMNELGNPPINNLDDFVNVLKTVKGKYPDMAPFVMGPPYFYGLTYILELFGTGGFVDYEENGNICSQIRNPGAKQAYLFINRLVREGLIPPESLIYPYDQFMQRLAAGKIFAVSYYMAVPAEVNPKFQAAGMTAKMKVLPDILTDRAKVIDSDIGWSGIFITRSCKKPDRAIRFMEFMMSDEGQKLTAWGIEGVHYVIGKDGKPAYATPEIAELAKDTTIFHQKTGINMWIFGCSLKYISVPISSQAEEDPLLQEWLNNFKKIMVHKPELFYVQATRAPSGSEEAIIANKVTSIYEAERMKVITAKTQEEAGRLFDEIIRKAEEAGLSRLEEWQTRKYQEIIKRYR